MITHIPALIPLYGIPNLWDMTHYEKGHIIGMLKNLTIEPANGMLKFLKKKL
jgi:hypothetical protein